MRRGWPSSAGPSVALVLSLAAPGCRPSAPAPPPPPATLAAPAGTPAELTEAERAFLDGRLDRAVELLKAGPRDSGDGLLLAYALLLRGDESEATRVAEETLRAPHHRDERTFRGLLALLTGKLDRAIDELGGAGAPPRFFSRVLHAETLTLARRFEAAQAATEALARDFPQEPLVPHTRGHLESARGNWAAAIESYTRSAQLGGRNPDLDDGVAAAGIALGHYPEARQAIARCREDFPDYPEILYQAIRLERARPGAAGQPLRNLVAEYRRRTKRQDRLAEIDLWMGKT